MAQMASPRPLGESDLANELGLYPVRSPRLSDWPRQIRKRRLFLLQAVKSFAKLRKKRIGEASADLPGIEQPMLFVVVSQEQRPKSAPNTWISEAANYKFLAVRGFDFQPIRI